MREGEVVAAVDLGSNSFHMLVARIHAGQIQVIDRMKEMVRLAGGLGDDGRLNADAMARGITCLERFGQRLAGMPRGSVRIVGTNTLRAAKNGAEFIRKAEQAIGHPVEIIAGREEARLVYLGVAHSDVAVDGQRLVVDIGGGSTELIIGQGFRPRKTESVPLGCVSLTRAFFADGRIDKQRLQRAERRAEIELSPYKEEYRKAGWQRAVGSSGSARALAAVAVANGWSESGITRESLAQIRKEIVRVGHIDELELEGLSDERRPVFVGGFVAMQAVFAALKIERMAISDGALREGLVYDWLDRDEHDDIRRATVKRLQKMFSVDVGHADRVAETAGQLFRIVAKDWGFAKGPEDVEAPPFGDWLDTAARLHEIGLAIAHSGYHHHGAYVLAHADMPGLTRAAQAVVASLVHAHRRKFKANRFELLDEAARPDAMRLTTLLRLAVLLHRDRAPRAHLPNLSLTAEGNRLHVRFPEDWLDEHPLTVTDLEREQDYLAMSNFELGFE